MSLAIPVLSEIKTIKHVLFSNVCAKKGSVGSNHKIRLILAMQRYIGTLGVGLKERFMYELWNVFLIVNHHTCLS